MSNQSFISNRIVFLLRVIRILTTFTIPWLENDNHIIRMLRTYGAAGNDRAKWRGRSLHYADMLAMCSTETFRTIGGSGWVLVKILGGGFGRAWKPHQLGARKFSRGEPPKLYAGKAYIRIYCSPSCFQSATRLPSLDCSIPLLRPFAVLSSCK